MKNLTLVIPAKQEEDSLPIVLNEIADLDCKKFVVLHSTDFKTLEAIKNFDCKIIYQNNKGYGSAIIEGIENTQTEYVCIFNADGSFDPKYLKDMLALCKNYDFIFMSRYLNEGASDDDTLLTKIGNYTFTLLAKVFFSLKLFPPPLIQLQPGPATLEAKIILSLYFLFSNQLPIIFSVLP